MAVPHASDPYALVAAHYDRAIGSRDQRSDLFKTFFVNLLKQHGCRYVLDAACGTGIDSVILLEHGFKVVSVDASAHMLEYARKIKADNAGDPRYDDWIILQAQWEGLPSQLRARLPAGADAAFDAVLCMANSFPHVLDEPAQRRCMASMARCVRRGGLLLVDHRNYDAVLDGDTPTHNVYYKYSNPLEIKSTLVMEGAKPKMITMDFCLEDEKKTTFSLSFYPHRVADFSRLVQAAFERAHGGAAPAHRVLGDFQPLGAVPMPGFYLHVVHNL